MSAADAECKVLFLNVNAANLNCSVPFCGANAAVSAKGNAGMIA